MTNNNTTKYRVKQVEKKVKSIESKIDIIMENHLPHIHQDIIRLETKITVFTCLNIGALVTAIFVNQLLK